MEKQNAVSAALAVHKNIKNKTAEAFDLIDKAEEVDVKKQTAGDADIHQHQEQARRGEQLLRGARLQGQVQEGHCEDAER